MTFKEVMAALRAAGTAETTELYVQGGATGPCFGVDRAALEQIAESVGPDQAMALQLYETGVFDARLLATLIAEPAKFTPSYCDRWVKACAEPLLTEALVRVVAETIHAEKKSDVWRRSKGEWKRVAGWTLVELLAEPGVALHPWLKGRVGEIHRNLKSAPANVKQAMCGALIAIGGHRPEFRERVLGLSKKLKLPAVKAGVDALQAAWEAGQ